MLPLQMLKYSCLRSSIQESNPVDFANVPRKLRGNPTHFMYLLNVPEDAYPECRTELLEESKYLAISTYDVTDYLLP